MQIQNRGTLGGNVANGSPAGDTLPVLAAAEAVVVLRSVDGERRVPFGEFYTGYRATVRRPDELIVAFEIPPVEGRQWFRKVGTRAAQAISKVVMAAVRGPGPGSRSAASPRRSSGSPASSRRSPAARTWIEAVRRAGAGHPARSTTCAPPAAYRRDVAANLLRRFWRKRGDGHAAGAVTELHPSSSAAAASRRPRGFAPAAIHIAGGRIAGGRRLR